MIRTFDSGSQQTDQEYAEVCYVPDWVGDSKNRVDYRFLATHEPLCWVPLGDEASHVRLVHRLCAYIGPPTGARESNGGTTPSLRP
jgi:hypothetical protein